MPIELYVTDGTTSQTLSLPPATILDYTPRNPDQEARKITDENDGGEQPATYWRNVTETATIRFDTPANARTAIAALNRLFESARARQAKGIGAKVYVKFRPDTTETLYRSELLAGRVFPTNLSGAMVLNVGWTRRFYWEADNETQLNLYNNVSGSAAQQTLYNYSRDADGKNNFVKIAAASIGGDLPTPARFELYNNYASANRTNDFFIGHLLEGASAFPHIIEAESGTGGSVASYSGASGGQYVNLGPAGTAENIAWYGTLSNSLLTAAGSNWFRVLVFMASAPSASDIQMRAKLSVELLTTLWDGDYISVPSISTSLLDLGVVQLPSYLVGAPAFYPLNLELRAKRTTTNASATVPVDFIMLMPLQSWRVLKQAGYSTAQYVTLKDDPANDLLYTEGWSGGGAIGNYTALGEPVMLVPNAINCIYLAVTPLDSILRSTQIKVFYRPRRLTI